MRLNTLRLRNFRQHADTHIDFAPGLTGIIGPNGAGKSTILEAIAWAIYGAQAARGTNDTLKFARAPARAPVEVELEFALGGHEYRVLRTLKNAEVFLDGGAAPVAATVGGATQYLQARLGMSREEFFNTYFTGQKELQFLAAMGPTERGRFLSQVLGYERLRRAQEIARGRRKELHHEVRALRAVLGDLEEIRATRARAEQQRADAAAALAQAEEEARAAASVQREIAPRWSAAQAARDQHRELTHRIQSATQERDGARREAERAASELAAVAAAEAELAPLRQRLATLPSASDECARLAELARQEQRREMLARQLADAERELAAADARLEQTASAPERERQYAAEVEALRTRRDAADADLTRKREAWLRDKQDAHTNLKLRRDEGQQLKEQVRTIREMGPEGTCPTCGRVVGADFERLLKQFDERWQEVVQDGLWWKNRFDQLEPKPEELAAAEAALAALTRKIEDRTAKLIRCQSAVKEREELTRDRAARATRLGSLRAELAALPTGYDADRHRAADALLNELRAIERRAAALETTAARRATVEAQHASAATRIAEADAHASAAAEERAALGFSEAAFAALTAEHDAAARRLRDAELRAADARGVAQVAEQALATAASAEDAYHARAREVELRELDLRYHDELDDAYDELKNELNDQVRPELSEIASLLLGQLTDGRYTAMEMDEKYNILVLDEGEEKPVISGGEEDIANLVLRLALSQMIAERAGHPLSLLILDEVFGSLDVARRDNVVQLLHHLEDRFEQVILITHVEGIRESLDQVLRVEFDERTGTATVREESFLGDEALVQVGAG